MLDARFLPCCGGCFVDTRRASLTVLTGSVVRAGLFTSIRVEWYTGFEARFATGSRLICDWFADCGNTDERAIPCYGEAYIQYDGSYYFTTPHAGVYFPDRGGLSVFTNGYFSIASGRSSHVHGSRLHCDLGGENADPVWEGRDYLHFIYGGSILNHSVWYAGGSSWVPEIAGLYTIGRAYSWSSIPRVAKGRDLWPLIGSRHTCDYGFLDTWHGTGRDVRIFGGSFIHRNEGRAGIWVISNEDWHSYINFFGGSRLVCDFEHLLNFHAWSYMTMIYGGVFVATQGVGGWTYNGIFKHSNDNFSNGLFTGGGSRHTCDYGKLDTWHGVGLERRIFGGSFNRLNRESAGIWAISNEDWATHANFFGGSRLSILSLKTVT